MKKFFLLVFVCIISFFICNNAFAEDFYIKNYNVKINVSETKILDIEEDIYLHFTSPRHGIIREIPIFMPNRNTGSKYGIAINGYAKLYDVEVFIGDKASNTNFQKFLSSSKTVNIKIGSENILVNGDVRYIIKYKMKLPYDNFVEFDEFYFNPIGTEWDTNINNASFLVTLPRKIKPIDYGMSIGSYGTVGYTKKDGNLKFDGKNFIGKTNRKLNNKEGITIRVVLPQGYFVKKINNYKLVVVSTVLVILLLTLFAYLIWFIWGKDEPVIPVVNFYPPKNMNSAQIGVEIDNKADAKDVISLIVYLAAKGYIRIHEFEDKSFTLEKLKNYDGKNKIEEDLMKIIFGSQNIITEEELKKSKTFYKDFDKISKALEKETRKNMFNKNSCSWGKMLIMTVCLLGQIFSLFFVLNSFSLDFIDNIKADTISLFIISIIIIFTFIFGKSVTSSNISLLSKIFFIIKYLTMLLCAIVLLIIEKTLDISSTNNYILALNIIGIVITVICLQNMPKYNKKGRKILGDILGFKKFIETAEKHRIELLVQENPSYCYDVLPFAYVLGISDKWIKKFEALIPDSPDWFRGKSFTLKTFNNFTKRMKYVSAASVENGGIPKESRSSRYRSSGGSFSGGGFGGGGGHSW